MRNRIILLLIGVMCYAGMGNAQEDKTEKAVPAIVSDSVEVAAPDSTVQAVLMAADSVGVPEVKMKLAFKPNPTKAVLFALVPGLGQIYNRKYWKLPIVYGGLMGCMYAVIIRRLIRISCMMPLRIWKIRMLGVKVGKT